MDCDNSSDAVLAETSDSLMNIKQELIQASDHDPPDITALTNSVLPDDPDQPVSMSLPNTPIKFPPPEANTERFAGIRNKVEDKSKLLSNVWSELYNLLGEYKSELFSVEAASQSFSSMDSSQLKQELIQRDDMIYERDNEINELRSQLEQLQQHVEELQNHSEQCRLEMDTKDRLLSQYQQDLMEKETQLMTSNTKIGRLENRLKMLESKANAAPQQPGPVPRKLIKMSPMGRGGIGMNSRGRGRGSHMMPGGAGRLVQAGVGRFTPAGSRMGASPQVQRRRFPTPQQQVVRRPSQPPAPPPVITSPQPQQVVCIEVDDDDESALDVKPTVSTPSITPVKTESKDAVQSSIALSQLAEAALNDDIKPGFSLEQFDVNEPMMIQKSDDPNQDYAQHQQQLEAWQQQLGSMMTSPGRVQQSAQPGTPSSKVDRPSCDRCGRIFSQRGNLARHIKLVHEQRKDFSCLVCGFQFGLKQHCLSHMLGVHHISKEKIEDFFKNM